MRNFLVMVLGLVLGVSAILIWMGYQGKQQTLEKTRVVCLGALKSKAACACVQDEISKKTSVLRHAPVLGSLLLGKRKRTDSPTRDEIAEIFALCKKRYDLP